MPKGGKQPGAGRPKGSKTRIDFKSYWNEEEIADFMKTVKKRATESDVMMKCVLEYLAGRPVQQIEGTGEDGAFTVAWKKIK